MSFEKVHEFELKIADYFGAPFAVAVDSCTHGVELCLRYLKNEVINVPIRTYLSIPFLAEKLSIELNWVKDPWKEYYFLTDNIIDAAVLWRQNSYVKGSFMSLSFQYQKHLGLGRGGMILCPNRTSFVDLKKLSYDGRLPNIPWREQNIKTIGYHYYMTPETAQLGLDKFNIVKNTKPREWKYEDWPDLTKLEVFKNQI